MINTKEKIGYKHWDKAKQKAKRSYVGSPELNLYLDKFKADVQRLIRIRRTENPGISVEEIKNEINQTITNVMIEDTTNVFFSTFDKFIESQKNTKKARTIQKYRTLKTHLQDYQSFKSNKLSFEKITPTFESSFLDFLISELQLTNNTIGKYISTLKTFLNWAAERAINKHYYYKKFKVPNENADIIYLTEDELLKLYWLDLSMNSRLAQVRDVFCFACFTGQRFSDISTIKRNDLSHHFWKIHAHKTKDTIEIPLSRYAKDILSKYQRNERPLPIISHQKTNEYLKELGKLIELTEEVTVVRYRGAERIEHTTPKYELLTTHTARRTFVTLSLEKGMRAETVMEITGHKSYKVFKKYIKITGKVKAIEMKNVWDGTYINKREKNGNK